MRTEMSLVLSLLLLFPLSGYSQVEVDNANNVNFGEYPEEFIIGDEDGEGPKLFIGPNYTGFYFQRLTNFFQMLKRGDYMYVAGTGNGVVLYDTQLSQHNSLICYANCYSDFTDFEEETGGDRSVGDAANMPTGKANALSLLSRLNPVTYRWKADVIAKAVPGGKKQSHGFLAQEVAEVLPDAVSGDSVGDMTLNYNAILPLVAGSLQELQGQIATQHGTLARLTADNIGKATLSVAPVSAGEDATLHYSISGRYTDAFILITTMDNKVAGKISLTGTPHSDIATLPTRGMSPGIYNCSLLVDDRIAGTANIVITEK